MELKVVIGWDEANQVYQVVESDIENLWLAADSKDALIAAISEAANEYVRRAGGTPGLSTVRVYEEVGGEEAGGDIA